MREKIKLFKRSKKPTYEYKQFEIDIFFSI